MKKKDVLREELTEELTDNIDRMINALQTAYKLRDSDDPEQERQLIDLMVRTKNLKQELLKAIKPDSESATTEDS